MEACIVGTAPSLIWPLPFLLARAGFEVDAITTSSLLRASRFVRTVERAETLDAIVQLAYERICNRERPYDWVIAGDDATVWELSRLDWPAGVEPKYLPRARVGQVDHIYSKIGLSQALERGAVKTPRFRVAPNCAEAVSAAREFGYPVLIKTDSDSGGVGVYRCESDGDVGALAWRFGMGPMLVQEWIAGPELDLSAIFFDRKLVHFAYSEIEWTVPSSTALSAVRRYFPLPLVNDAVFEELAVLGRALNANGFVSIACIKAADGSGRYYFEADMRPNAWTDVSQFFGDDAAARIRGWFARGEALSKPNLEPAAECMPMRIPHFLRIARWELLVNRHSVWRFIPWSDTSVVLRQIGSRMLMPVVRSLVPWRMRRAVKRGMLGAGIAFP